MIKLLQSYKTLILVCHSERSEESRNCMTEILRIAQDDKLK